MTDTDNGWKFAQCFGDKGDVEDVTEADIISAVEFDHTGDYLATGDRGGRVVLFERNEGKRSCEYKFYTEFQSHEPEFDYLKSLEIEEKINQIKWCKRQNSAHFLLSTNDKTIKLWKVFDKSIRIVTENNMGDANADIKPFDSERVAKGKKPILDSSLLGLPRMTYHDSITAAIPRKIYQNAHGYHINSISINSDDETFISADDLRINLWNFQIPDQSFNIVDIKPVNMEELTEVITCTAFHPTQCNTFVYCSSRGVIRVNDMRMNALCDNASKGNSPITLLSFRLIANLLVYESEEDQAGKSFFSEIISSISDFKFSSNGRYMLSRDYLTLKIWDMNMDSKPVKTISVHDHLRSKLCDLYENDCIFDKFECHYSGDGEKALTGSYSNFFHIYNVNNEEDTLLQADKSAFRAKKVGSTKNKGAKSSRKEEYTDVDSLDFGRKIIHASWHPRENTVALAATNNLFLFQG